MRYRTAAIFVAVLIGGMFCLPAAVFAVFPAVKHGPRIPVLLDVVVFCLQFRWFLAFLALPIIAVLFTLAALTGDSRREVRR